MSGAIRPLQPSEAIFLSSVTSTNAFNHPLYTYHEESDSILKERVPNLNTSIVSNISDKTEMSFVPEASSDKNTFSPIDIIDYIYAILHSPTYRAEYEEYLKIEFPRIPYPKDKETFMKLAKYGCELRQTHLLESNEIDDFITNYPIDGNNIITRKTNKNDWEIYDSENKLVRVLINDEQYFDNIPLDVWEFFVGGYQPAQKWLKDHTGKKLGYKDIQHYQRIIVALAETIRIMQEIDKVNFE